MNKTSLKIYRRCTLLLRGDEALRPPEKSPFVDWIRTKRRQHIQKNRHANVLKANPANNT